MTGLDRLVENYQHWVERADLSELAEILRLTSVELAARGVPGVMPARDAARHLREFVMRAGDPHYQRPTMF